MAMTAREMGTFYGEQFDDTRLGLNAARTSGNGYLAALNLVRTEGFNLSIDAGADCAGALAIIRSSYTEHAE